MSKFKYGDVTEKISGAALRVHRTVGCRFEEVIYQRASNRRFTLSRIKMFDPTIHHHPTSSQSSQTSQFKDN